MNGYRARVRTARVAGCAAVLAAVALATGACGTAADGQTSGTPAASPAGSAPSPSTRAPRDILLAAAPDGSQGSFRFAIADAEATGSGVVDADAERMQMITEFKDPDLDLAVKISFLLVGQESWMKVSFSKRLPGLPRLPKKWLHLDRAKISSDDGLPLSFDDPDPASAATILAASADVTESGAGRYRGTVDLTAAADAEVVDKKTLAALGVAAKRVPFEAVVDARGRLTSLVVDVPAAGGAPAFRRTATYRDYGAATAPAPPSAAQSQEAPAAAYEMLNA
jgi:hypothetical protein